MVLQLHVELQVQTPLWPRTWLTIIKVLVLELVVLSVLQVVPSCRQVAFNQGHPSKQQKISNTPCLKQRCQEFHWKEATTPLLLLLGFCGGSHPL
jgi:hypothetical protein